MKRKVVYARIHDIKVVLPAVGQLDTEFPSKRKTLPGLQMFWDGTTLEIEIGAKAYGIPAANVQWMEFGPAETVVNVTPGGTATITPKKP